MIKLQLTLLLLLCSQVFWITAQLKSKTICVSDRFEKQCNILERETKEIKCAKVQDSIECANLLRNRSSGFGIFSAESTLLLAALNYDDLTVLKELRHMDRQNYSADFESVVVVKATHKNGIEGLKGLNYCHPGLYYDHTERWSERFLKYFERTVTTPNCDKQLTSPVEIEIDALATHFKSACYPGAWSNNPEEDQRLKKKYPQLCELCNSPYSPCEYTDKNRHLGALRCLIKKESVAYVSLQDTQDFFSPLSEYANLRNDYAYLCPDETIQLISDNSKTPCTWMRQPWPVIISNNQDSVPLKATMSQWFYGRSSWEIAIKEILTADSLTPVETSIQKPRDFFYPFRELPFSQSLCSTQANWCTKSFEEKEKCDIVRVAGITTGIQPLIECNDPVGDAIHCLKEVNEERADFVAIDSSLGYIARHPYNLTTALYGESDKDAAVVVVVRANSNFKRFEDLQNSKACIAEYNGIASVSFIKIGKTLGFLPKEHCNHSRLLGEFFGSSCVPGAIDPSHGVTEFENKLCSICPQVGSGVISSIRPISQGSETNFISSDRDVEFTTSNIQSEIDVMNSELNCNADQTNIFYGNLGALLCLYQAGDVAIVGLKDLNENAKALGINPNEFQVICKNGTLAEYTGFDVDSNCALASFVDSEIVVKPKNPKTEGIINALISYEKYFAVDPELKIFSTFNGHMDLLFNTHTTGFASYDEKDLGTVVDNYNNLFKSLEACGIAFKSYPATTFIYATLFFTLLISRLLQ
ncbi:transferrin-like [Contarinia nasturtii]|uniref:transferrin-like n=1 Tax=Contarinia nasturtii TaxID=265458 RepID=UPI0012D43EC5|nr:transferrin-like [Contarinia nasturtii]